MRSLVRFLVVFMALRVLAPPGVCLYELSLPLFRLVAGTLHFPRLPTHSDDDDDRVGCCICQLPAGVEAKPVAPPRPTLCVELSVVFTPVPASAPVAVGRFNLRPQGRAPRLGHVPLLI